MLKVKQLRRGKLMKMNGIKDIKPTSLRGSARVMAIDPFPDLSSRIISVSAVKSANNKLPKLLLYLNNFSYTIIITISFQKDILWF